jgi:predicted HicB family RNase H-like nuclease
VSDITRVHIELPDGVHKAANVAAVRRDITLKAWVTEAIEEKAEREAEAPRPAQAR